MILVLLLSYHYVMTARLQKVFFKHSQSARKTKDRNEEIFFDSFHNVYARLCKKLNNIKLFANISNILFPK